MPCIVRCFAVAFLPFCFSHRAADQSCLPDAKAVRAAPSLLAVSQHLQRKGAVGNQSKEAAVAPNDDLAQTLEDALSWEIKQIEKSMGEPTGDEKPSKVMGVALNGKDDLRMLRGAVIIGFAGVALLFIVFCLMRKFAPWVYLREEDMELEPLGDGTASPATAPRFFANPHVTLLDWTRKVRQTTPEDEMAAAGLDGWAFLEFRRLIWRIFSVIGAMLAVVLLPMHYQAHKDSQMLDILSIFDIGRDPLPDWMLWVHAVMVWFVVGASSWTISMAQEHFTERRYQWLKEIPFPRANTVLVRNIPAMYRSDAALLQYFTNVFNDKDAVERAYVVRRTGQLPRQVKNLKAAKLEVLHAKQHWEEAGSEEETPEWFYLQRCQKRVKTITEEVAAAQGRLKDAAARGDPLVCTSTGFVTFNTELTARLASREQYTRDVTDFQISMPPDPEDVIYDNLADQEINSTGWNWAGVAAIWGVFTIWIPFVVLISSWTTFGAVQEMLPSLKEFVQQHPWLDKILTGVFATIALKVVLAFLPTALYLIIRNLMSVKSSSEAQILMQRWYGLFLVMFVLLVTSLSRGVTLTLVSIAQKPGRIFSLLADFLPSASHFYFNYMILGWTAGSVPDPCLYFTTDSSTREVELELPKWKEGKFLVVKFLDTHNNAHNGQRNIDVGIIGMIGYTGRFAKQQIPLGPWMKRSVRQPWVHPNELKSMFSSSGWVCDGRDFTGGCRSGQTDFHQTNVYTVTFRCTTSGFDLCEKCAHDPTLGRINDDAMQSDLEALLDPSMCKLAVSRLRNLWRRNWVESLSKYFKAGLLDNLVQALQKCTENPRPEDERAPNQRQSTETQKRQARRAMLQLLTELTQRILGGVDLGQGSNDLVWAIRSEEDQHHWDEGRIVQQPKKFLETLGRPLPPPAGLSAATLATGTEGGVEADESPGDAAGSSAPTEAVNTEAEATPEGKEASKEGHFLISWRDGQAPSWVHPQHVWRIADEDVVMATAGLFLELAKGPHCDTAKLSKLLQQGADLSAANGEGCPALLLAVRAEAPVAALTVLLENGACPDAAGREGVTALELLLRKEREESADAEWIRQCADVLRRNRATLEATQEEHEARLIELRRSFGIKMVGALLLVQSPTAVPAEVLEALHLLFRDLPKEVVKESLEPQAYCALAALLQHLVGSTDNLGVALVGCRIMRALYNQPELKLRYLIRSHGVLRWTQRLRGDITQCGIHRQGHHDKVTAEELSKEAQLLAEDLRQGEPTDLDAEWRNNQKLMEVVQALHAAGDDAPGRLAPADGLFALRELLKKTEKGGLDEERCTAWELEQAGVPGLMLQYLMDGTSRVNQDRWKLFTEAFGDSSKQSKKGLTRFIKAMHAVIETGETLPITVWKHKKERGLKALTEPLALKLRSVRNGEVQTQKLQVAAEPLLQLADLTRFLTKVTPCVDEAYLQFCHRIIGHRIRDLHSEKEYEVKSFETYTLGLPIPIHTVMATDGEATESWVLANRAYHILGDLAATNVAQLELKVAFNIIQALSGDYMASLEQLQERLDGAEAAKISEATLAAALASALQMAEANRQEVLDFLAAEKARCAAASGPATGGATSDGATEAALDPNMRVHTVMIAVSDEIPFELFWPMVKDDIVAAVRALCPRGSPGMEEAVQQGVLQNGMGPIAKKLTLQEAENLATRVGHVVQTGVSVDPEALQEAQKEKANSQQNESIQLSCRAQFNRENSWVPGTVVGQLGDMLSLVDDEGVLFDKLPRARVRLPPGKRDSLGSAGGAPIQAVLSQVDLVRVREHLRRRQEEWAERRAQNTGGSGGNGARPEEAAAGSEQRTPTSSPTSALPALAALVHRSRASSAPSIDGAGAMRRGILLSRDAPLSEVDAAGLDVVQFMEDEGMGDDDFDDEEGGPDDEDEEDLASEPQEDVEMAPRLGGSRGSDGENRDLSEPGSMEEELRMLGHLRAMEQIISEVLDPAGRSRRRDGEDFALGAPMASLRIRMGGLRLPVEGMSQIRRQKGIATEPLRWEFPSFVRSADASSATATLDHPVVERLGVSDLKACEGDVPMAEPEGVPAPVLTARLCLYPKETEVTGDEPADAAAKVRVQPILLPRSWNLLKAMQYLQQQGSEGKAEAEPVQKVPLENWDLGYELVMEGSSEDGSAMEVDSVGATRTDGSPAVALGRSKKRRRTLPFNELSDAVAREMKRQVLCPEKGEPVTSLVEQGDNITVTQAIELLRLMHSFAPSLNLEVSNWVSSKLDRKLRYQLEDPFSVISGTLPRWAVTLPKVCPFLFSLKTRKMLMKYTAFGPSFAVHWTQEHKVGSFLKRRATVQTELNAQTDPRKMQELSQELSNIEEHVVRSNYWLGTLQSTLVRLEKGEEFLRQADVAMGFLAKASKLMEVQFEGETGFGVAVTQSFYVEVAQALQDRSVNSSIPMWVEDDDSGTGQQHLLCRKGLLLKPLPPGPQRDQVVHRFRFLGRLMGQALREGFIVPLPLADEFFALLLDEPLGPSNLPKPGHGVAGELLGALNEFLEDLALNEPQGPEERQAWRRAQAERSDFGERFLTASDRPDASPQEPMSFNEYTRLVGLCFLETGLSGAELCPEGDSIAVTADNVTRFVEEAANFWFNTGVREQVNAFRAGLNDVFPFNALKAFTRTELREMFCGEDRIDWDEQALLNHIHPTGGLTEKSPSYKFLVAVLLELGQAERSRFLDFVSSCPRLPPGGIAKFHVDVFPDTSASRQAFPRSRACANQLYLPPYTSKEELQAKLVEAMHSSAGHHEQRVRDQ